MPFYNAGPLKIYKFTSFEGHGLVHAVFTRHGGYSPTPWHSLNFGASVGDEIQRVIKNREIALVSLNISSHSVFDVYQVHSSKVVKTNRPLAQGESHARADGILTNQSAVTLMMRFADCVPILLFDPEKRVVGIVHAGWKGTVDRIVRNAVTDMADTYGSKPANIMAAIGPSIGPDHYTVGKDVIERVEKSFKSETDKYINNIDGRMYFDLWKANENILMEVGVNQIELAGICTQCNVNDWYSHRGENGQTGRFGVVFSLGKYKNNQ